MIRYLVSTLAAIATCLSMIGCGSSRSTSTDEIVIASDDYCPAGAFYDEQEDACFIDCDELSDEQCDALEQKVFGDLEEFINTEYSGNDSSANGMDSIIAEYRVGPNLSLSEISISQAANDAAFRQIWDSATKLLPKKEVQQFVSQFIIDSDGPEETLAYVMIDENEPQKWIIGYDNEDYVGPKDKEFIHTTIHEFGHIVFLGMGQVDMTSMGSCDSYAIDEGCTQSDSYLNRYFQTFWADLFSEHQAAQGDEDAQLQFYDDYPNHFVSEYAATNPVEDAAEIFTHFVLRDKPTDALSTVNQKILFMHEVERLKKLRTTIRGKLQVTS